MLGMAASAVSGLVPRKHLGNSLTIIGTNTCTNTAQKSLETS